MIKGGKAYENCRNGKSINKRRIGGNTEGG